MCVHILGGHKASINCVSIHPSGKLAVSVAQDNTLKVWNLVQGKRDKEVYELRLLWLYCFIWHLFLSVCLFLCCKGRIAFTRRLKGSANLVKWMKPSGAAYMLVVGDKIEVRRESYVFNSFFELCFPFSHFFSVCILSLLDCAYVYLSVYMYLSMRKSVHITQIHIMWQCNVTMCCCVTIPLRCMPQVITRASPWSSTRLAWTKQTSLAHRGK